MNMKATTTFLTTLITAGTLLALAGCGNKDSASAPPEKHVQKTPDTAASGKAPAADTLKQAAGQAQDAASKMAQEVDSKAQGMIDTAKKLVADSNWTQSMDTLQQLKNVKLTPEQQAIVDSLLKQVQVHVQKATTDKASGDATKSLNNLLKK
ncbi:MAG: hypothetical protein EXS31_15730 [Pedosphaera sp.]|nr:hypothetical protein [Pedosphaera sp.]